MSQKNQIVKIKRRKKSGASRWRFCYQQGLPSLVSQIQYLQDDLYGYLYEKDS